MLELLRTRLGPVSRRDAGRIDPAARTAAADVRQQMRKPADGGASTGATAVPTREALDAIQDDVKIMAAGLPPEAQKLVAGIKDATARLQAKMKEGKAIAAADPDLKLLRSQVDQLGAMLEKVAPGSAKDAGFSDSFQRLAATPEVKAVAEGNQRLSDALRSGDLNAARAELERLGPEVERLKKQ